MYAQKVSSRLLGLFGLLGALALFTTLVLLQLWTGVDWRIHYVSDFANGPYGALFTVAVLLHGAGNLSLVASLSLHLARSRLRAWASFLFGAAAFGILVTGIFPTDPSGVPLSAVGFIHQTAVATSFPIELAALLLFSAVFAQSADWKAHGRFSLALSIGAAVGLSTFFAAVLTDWLPGLGERIALASFLLWEAWAAWRLMRQPVAAGAVELRGGTLR